MNQSIVAPEILDQDITDYLRELAAEQRYWHALEIAFNKLNKPPYDANSDDIALKHALRQHISSAIRNERQKVSARLVQALQDQADWIVQRTFNDYNKQAAKDAATVNES